MNVVESGQKAKIHQEVEQVQLRDILASNSHEIGIFQTLEMTELKLSLYEICLCELFQGAFPKIFPSFDPTCR